jgi:membrane glycosyltransferase
VAPSLLPWFAPLAFGLLFSIPLAVLMGSTRVGKWLAKCGILRIPEEIDPSYLVRQHQHHLAHVVIDQQTLWDQNLLNTVIEDPATFTLHTQIQKASGQEKSMSSPMRSALLAAYRDGTFDLQAQDLERQILLDMDLLEDLHAEAQLRKERSVIRAGS